MQIDQLARVTSVSISTIRHYESVGLLPPRHEQKYNEYSEPHVHAIKLVSMAQNIGLSLREIISVLAQHDTENSDTRLNRALMLLTKHRNKLTARAALDESKSRSLNSLNRELRQLMAP